MQVNNNNNSISFSSLRCPVKPFTMRSPKGLLYCSEIDYKQSYSDKFYKDIGKFFLDIFANTSSHPFWEKCRKSSLDIRIYDDYISSSVESYKKYFHQPDTTVLLIKDKKKHLVGALYTRSLDLNRVLKDDDTLYIDSLAVKPSYRGKNIGKKLLTKVLKASKDRFSDAFLVAYKEAALFYEKLGFHKMNKNDSSCDFAISELAKERIDYPEYADFMEMKLDKKLPEEWFTRIKNK